MTDKQLRHLSRRDLLELLVEQTKTVESLRHQLELTNRKLESREISIREAGSIAEASVKITGVLEAAQQAADLYLENVRVTQNRCDEMLAQAKTNAEQLLYDARVKADWILADARQQAAVLLNWAGTVHGDNPGN